MRRLLIGACAGLIATAPMTGVMKLLHRRLPFWERGALPPRRITTTITRQLGINKKLDEPEMTMAILVSHFGFGAVGGALYAPLAAKRREPAAIKGAAFGILVWAVSYLGWLPASGLLQERSPRRHTMMIVAHLVWGIVLGMLTEQLEQRDSADE